MTKIIAQIIILAVVAGTFFIVGYCIGREQGDENDGT